MSKKAKKFITLYHRSGNVSHIRADRIVYLYEQVLQENGEVFANTTVRLKDGLEINADVEARKIIEAIAEMQFSVHRDDVERPKAPTQKGPKTQRKYGIPVGYIGTAEVQALLNKSRGTIWRMVNDGRLPQPLQDGCIKIWDRKEMLRWIENAKFCW